MAAISAWSKPGAWALESEENDALENQNQKDKGYSSSDSHQSFSDFPSLSAAAVTKIPKKKKKQTLSLAEFNTGNFQPSAKTLGQDEILVLPTGPRERSAEELERSRGFGRRGEDSVNRWGSSRVSEDSRRGSGRENRDLGPSRADEVDDWGKDKKSVGAFERRESRDLGPSRADEVDDWGKDKKSVGGFERRERERGFFDSQSRADESDSWISKKGLSHPITSEGRRERRGFDLFNNREGSDSDIWGKKREENFSGNGRPRIVLQPRTLPIVNGNNGEEKKGVEVKREIKGPSPFGEARPREDVLKEKGKDWKEIDEKLEVVKIQDSGRKGFGAGSNGPRDGRTDRAWRKPELNDLTLTPPLRINAAGEQLPEN